VSAGESLPIPHPAPRRFARVVPHQEPAAASSISSVTLIIAMPATLSADIAQMAACSSPIWYVSVLPASRHVRRVGVRSSATPAYALGLHGMAKAFADLADADEPKDLAHADWLALLLDRETSWRKDKRLTTRLRAAKLRHQASVEDVYYRTARGLDRALFQKLSTGEWIAAHDNLALVGPSEPAA